MCEVWVIYEVCEEWRCGCVRCVRCVRVWVIYEVCEEWRCVRCTCEDRVHGGTCEVVYYGESGGVGV